MRFLKEFDSSIVIFSVQFPSMQILSHAPPGVHRLPRIFKVRLKGKIHHLSRHNFVYLF